MHVQKRQVIMSFQDIRESPGQILRPEHKDCCTADTHVWIVRVLSILDHYEKASCGAY